MDTEKTWNRIEGNWRQLKGDIQSTWGELTDDDHASINGKRTRLVGKLQQLYGWSEERAKAQVDEFTHRVWKRRDDGMPTAVR